jgi:hypothetical protein
VADECPSGKYLEELVTANGRTIKHPLEDPGTTLGVPHSIIDWSGSEYDYADWHALLAAIVGRLEKAWVLLKTWPRTSTMPAAKWNALVERLNDVRKRYGDLRLPWKGPGSSADPAWAWGYHGPDFAFDASEEVGRAVQLLIDAQCLRQTFDSDLAALGGAPERPGTAHAPAPEGLSLIETAGLVGGAILLVGGSLYLATRIAKGRNSA